MEKFARIHEYVLEILALCLSVAISTAADGETCAGIVPMRHRAQNISITDFGGVGDGETVNTAAFAAAIGRIERLGSEGGAMLYIPAGVYLTERFNLTSNMTLYLAKDAVIKATQVEIRISSLFPLLACPWVQCDVLHIVYITG